MILKARELNIVGATMLRGMMGYGEPDSYGL
jgi:PII-like signaling protein